MKLSLLKELKKDQHGSYSEIDSGKTLVSQSQNLMSHMLLDQVTTVVQMSENGKIKEPSKLLLKVKSLKLKKKLKSHPEAIFDKIIIYLKN